jgi:hypothetical protein
MTFSNISSEMSSEEDNNEVQENVESAEVQEEVAQLEQATFEPEAVVELDKSHQDAEVVEAAFTETMQAAEAPASEEVSATPITLPDELPDADKPELIPENDVSPGAEVMIDTVPLPEKPADRVAIIDTNDGPRSASEEISATPITLPGQGKEGGVEATPINLPNPQDEVSATPITLPGQGKEGGVGATPINLPNPVEDVSADLRSSEEASLDGKGGDQVAIGTWPTPERQLDDIAIIDSNDGPRLGDDRVKIDTVPLPEDDLDGVAIIDTNDNPRPAVDDGPRLRDERVMIDTVPLPEDGLDGVAIIDTNDNPRPAVDDGPRLGDDRVKIDTVPLPEDGLDGVAIIDSNDGPRIDPMKAGMDDPLRDDLRMAEQGYLGEMTAPKGGEIPETGVGDLMDGIEGALDGAPGKVDDPFDSIPEWGETGDGQSLADAAAPGADTRAGIGVVKYVTGKIWGAITKDSGQDKGGGGGGVRGTPTPDAVEGTFEDPLGVMDIQEKTPTDYAESMMQPVDDEGQGREEPGMKMSAEELRDAQLNPYIQNTDEHVDVLPGSRGDMTDPKDFLIDNDLEPFAPGAGGGTNPLAKPSTNDDSPPPPPPPGGGKPGVSMDQMTDMVSSKPPDGGDGKPPDGADQVFKPSTNDDSPPPPPPPGGGKPGVSMEHPVDMVSSKPPDGGDGKPPDGADFNLVNASEKSLSPDAAPADLSSMMDEGTMLNANENKKLKDMDESNSQNMEPTDGKL